MTEFLYIKAALTTPVHISAISQLSVSQTSTTQQIYALGLPLSNVWHRPIYNNDMKGVLLALFRGVLFSEWFLFSVFGM